MTRMYTFVPIHKIWNNLNLGTCVYVFIETAVADVSLLCCTYVMFCKGLCHFRDNFLIQTCATQYINLFSFQNTHFKLKTTSKKVCVCVCTYRPCKIKRELYWIYRGIVIHIIVTYHGSTNITESTRWVSIYFGLVVFETHAKPSFTRSNTFSRCWIWASATA